MNWMSQRLADHCDTITKGTTPTSLGMNFTESGIPFVRVQNLVDGSVEFQNDDLFIDVETHHALRRSKIFPGDLLLSIAGTVGRCAIVPDDVDELNCNQAVAIIRPKKSIDRRFLMHWIGSRAAIDQISQSKVTATISNLSLSQIGELKVPLPPLEEQKRIAAILDQADELRRKRQRTLDRFNQLGQAIFIEMFGDPLGTPNAEIEWTTESLESNVKFMDYRGKTPLKADSGIRLITARNVKMGFINLEPQEFVEAESYGSWMTRGFPERGDVLFTTEAPLGHVAQLDTDETVVIGQRIITMKPDRDLIRPTYLEFFLRTPTFRTKMFENSTGSTVVGIKSKLLKKIDIRYPKAQLQDKFDVAIRQLRATAPHFENSARNMEALFVSLQHRAFRGELTVSSLKEAAA